MLPVPTVFANALNDARMITERPERFVLDGRVRCLLRWAALRRHPFHDQPEGEQELEAAAGGEERCERRVEPGRQHPRQAARKVRGPGDRDEHPEDPREGGRPEHQDPEQHEVDAEEHQREGEPSFECLDAEERERLELGWRERREVPGTAREDDGAEEGQQGGTSDGCVHEPERGRGQRERRARVPEQ